MQAPAKAGTYLDDLDDDIEHFGFMRETDANFAFSGDGIERIDVAARAAKSAERALSLVPLGNSKLLKGFTGL